MDPWGLPIRNYRVGRSTEVPLDGYEVVALEIALKLWVSTRGMPGALGDRAKDLPDEYEDREGERDVECSSM